MLSLLAASCAFQPQPSVAATFPTTATLPKLVVFDLDNTLWLPELYQLRSLRGEPVAGRDVNLLPGAEAALHELATCERWRAAGTKVGVASRTNKGAWARSLLTQFEVPGGIDEKTLDDFVSFQQIYTGSKVRHFERLHEASGIAYEDMLFFDDALGGQYGNCMPVAQLGVCAAHCPRGLTDMVWAHAIRGYAMRRDEGASVGGVFGSDGQWIDVSPRSADSNAPAVGGGSGPVAARVTKWLDEKSFGFVHLDESGRGRKGGDVFFHRSALPAGAATTRSGDAVRVTLGKDARGRLECAQVEPTAGADGRSDGGAAAAVPGGVSLPCFSMNMPFAALVAHGRKTLETRNHTMFEGTEGKLALLHVGRRTYPDGGKHRGILSQAGDDEAAIDRFTSLPSGFSRGAVVAVLELGETRLADEAQRSTDEVQSAACALGGDMGRYLTEVKRAAWLKQPVPCRGQPGLFRANVPKEVVPEGFGQQ